MSEETTNTLPNWRSFEERVFARFDTLDRRFDDMDKRFDSLEARVQRLEEESERRAVETKPIWERALAEILAVQQRLDKVEAALKDLSRKMEVMSLDMMQLRANMRDFEARIEGLESESAR